MPVDVRLHCGFQGRRRLQPQQGLGQLEAGRGQVDLDLALTPLQGRPVRLQCHGCIVVVLDVDALPLVFSSQVSRFLLLLGQRRFRMAQLPS